MFNPFKGEGTLNTILKDFNTMLGKLDSFIATKETELQGHYSEIASRQEAITDTRGDISKALTIQKNISKLVGAA